MSNVLKKITARAKQLRKEHPNSKWALLVKKAGAEYRSGKLGARKPKPKVWQTGHTTKRVDRRYKAKKPGKRKSKSGKVYTERRKNRSDIPGTLTGISTGTLKSAMKNRLKESLGKQLVRREMATTAKAFHTAGKQIKETRSQLRKLM